MDLIHRVLTCCPNISEVQLFVGHSGCLVTFEPQPCGFNFDAKRSTLPSLEVLNSSGYGPGEKPNRNRWIEYEAEHPQTSILYFPWKHFPRSIIEKVGYERIRSLGGFQTYFVKRNACRLKPGEKTNLDM
jgi:hypothetical protein